MIRPEPVRQGVHLPEDDLTAGPSAPAPAAKRPFDLLAASVCLALLSPPPAIVAVIVSATSPGSPFFRQTRIGRDRRPFVPYRFRTMYPGRPSDVHRQSVSSPLTADQ